MRAGSAADHSSVPSHVATRIHSQVTPATRQPGAARRAVLAVRDHAHPAPCASRRGSGSVVRHRLPGDVLLAADTTGGGHRWELIDDQPWTRIYVELAAGLPGSGGGKVIRWGW